MSRSAFAVKEARVRPTRQQVNLCGSCGKKISATELLCRGCRGTMGGLDLAVGGGSDESETSAWGSETLELLSRL